MSSWLHSVMYGLPYTGLPFILSDILKIYILYIYIWNTNKFLPKLTYRYLVIVEHILDDFNKRILQHHTDATDGCTQAICCTHVLYGPSGKRDGKKGKHKINNGYVTNVRNHLNFVKNEWVWMIQKLLLQHTTSQVMLPTSGTTLPDCQGQLYLRASEIISPFFLFFLKRFN